MSNLLHNSTKFTDRGGNIDVIAAVDAGLSPPVLTLTVRDSGAGIAPSTLHRVFDFFVQGETPGRGKSGLGIGLAFGLRLAAAFGLAFALDLVLGLAIVSTPTLKAWRQTRGN